MRRISECRRRWQPRVGVAGDAGGLGVRRRAGARPDSRRPSRRRRRSADRDPASEAIRAEAIRRCGASGWAASTTLPGRQQEHGAAVRPHGGRVADRPHGSADSAASRTDSGATPAPPPRLPVDTDADPGPGGRADRPGQRAETGRGTRAGYRDRPAAHPRGRGRPEPGARSLAAVALLRADLVSVRRPDPDGHRPGPDDQPQRVVPRRNGGAGEYHPGAATGDRHPFRERHDLGAADFRRDLRTHGGAARPRREPGRAPDRDQRRAAAGRRGLLRPPGRDRAAGHRPRGRRERRGPLGDHRLPTPAWDRAWRPTIAVP